jgi:hypothetical protein
MFKKVLSTVLLSSMLILPVFSQFTSPKVESITVKNLNSWEEQFNLETRRNGKYNILIKAKDLGGNEYIEGPHNIYLDPKSDLPVCGITNPFPDMRVVGNLNIVGTCIDDDGVSRVKLILDEGKDNELTVDADGKEFWSYYLDTTNLEEGPHTIKVIGYDINGIPVEGNPAFVTWQLDRKAPVTSLPDKEMGLLVSGKVSFRGIVTDGNGIKTIEYSTDKGEHFSQIKLANTKNPVARNFALEIDTKQFADGPAVLWFRATDYTGSVGLYSFLYFIDNTKPDVQIISPVEGVVKNGKFSAAGFAKDKIGITSLTWTFGTQTGEFELIPGNPYWKLDLDSTGMKDKSARLAVKAVDRAGNIVEVARTIPLNQEMDKPVVQLNEPEPERIFGKDDSFVIRGIARDDDAIQSVRIVVDNGEPFIQETRGPFVYTPELDYSFEMKKHTVTVTGIDENGLEGNPITRAFYTAGTEIDFSDIKVLSGKNIRDFKDGMEIHPESGSVFELTARSAIGIRSVHSEISWGKNGNISNDDVLSKPVSAYKYSLPLGPDFPKGVVNLKLQITDISEHVSDYSALMYITNTSVVKADEMKIVFDETAVSEDGTIINSPAFPVSATLLGAAAKKVELVPSTPFASAELFGNQILLVPGDAKGVSADVKIRVTTDKGKTVESQSIRFKTAGEVPVLKLNAAAEELCDGRLHEVNADSESIKIEGNASCATGLSRVYYHVLSANAELKGTVISAVHTEIKEEIPVETDKNGNFSLEVAPAQFGEGVHVVEVVAETSDGIKTAKAAAFSLIPEIEEIDGKMPAAKAPFIAWLDGGADVYAAAVYQGVLDINYDIFKIFRREEMQEGNNPLSVNVMADGGKAPVAGKYNAVKEPSLAVNIAFINDDSYLCGMPVKMAYEAKDAGKIQLYIDSSVSVGAVSYEINGEEVSGGDIKQSGSAKLLKPDAENPNRWIAEIPLGNLPARVNTLSATVKAGVLSKTVKGTFTVIRETPEENICDDEKIFAFAANKTVFDEVENCYVISNNSKFYFYANVTGPFRSELVSKTDGLKIDTDGNLIILSAEKDGQYNGVYVRVYDKYGDSFDSEKLNFSVDNSGPVLNLVEPVFGQWLGDIFKLSGTVADPSGISFIEYSLDCGETWQDIRYSGGKNPGITFSLDVNIKDREEGLINLDVRAADASGKMSTSHLALFKDVTAPSSVVVVPTADDIVNGETLIVFDAKDNGHLNKIEYVGPPVRGKQPVRTPVDISDLSSVLIGTEVCPIDDAMSFVFTDDAGNTNNMDIWSFIIDNESDLPVSEIHVPEEMQVITRDFTISGVIYDDDGDTSIFYKIDNGEYHQLPETGTSFAIDIPLSTLTDNEHTVTVYAVDINGVKGPETSRTFRISLEEPKGAVELPTIDTHNREKITISGWASDKNGIEKVQISLDNGNSYNDTVGTEKWSYDVDTRAIPGGTQVVFLKITDKYGIQGLYSSLINIDNDAPEITLELPQDDSTTTGTLFFSGYTYDNVGITELYVTIRNLDKGGKPVIKNIPISRVMGETMDISDLENGFYNMELKGKDKAGNATNISRNFHLDKNRQPATVDILYPLNGEHKNGYFTIYGQSESETDIDHLNLYIDGKNADETQITACGFFKFDMGPDSLTAGEHTYKVGTVLAGGKEIFSREQTITYSPTGPWITIDNFTYGDFAVNRPIIRGQADYSIEESERLLAKTKEITPEQKAVTEAKRVAKIDLSFDNGKTFKEISRKEGWTYRIENEDMTEGYHFLLIRATMVNGEVAVTRTIVQIDNTKPSIRLISPERGGRYNQVLQVSGVSNDNVELSDVTVTLRKGDKAAYEVPAFIQGLYLDFHFWGATLFELGAGLTFFDDNVKLQLEWGQFTQEQRDGVSDLFGIEMTDTRYGGNVFGIKILANIISIPFSYFFGHDFDWLYSSVAVGAQFSWFDLTQSGKTQTLAALIGQIELPKVKLKNVKMFSQFALYFEGSLWFIPTDVTSTVEIQSVVPQFSIGLRTNIF